jgi:hypothetical protein
MAYLTQFFYFVAQLKLMQIGFQLYVTGIAVARIDGPMNNRFAL